MNEFDRTLLHMLGGWLIGTVIGLFIIATVLAPSYDGYGLPHESAAQIRRDGIEEQRNLDEMARDERCYYETLAALIAKADGKYSVTIATPDCKPVITS